MRPWAGQSAPATSGVAITPHDTNDLARVPTRAVYVGTTGNMKVIMEDGQTVTFVGIAAGSVLPISVTRIFTTDTTASDIVALY